MLNIAGYEVYEEIYGSVNSRVYRGHRLDDGQPVILKVLKQDYPTPAELTRYRQEYEIVHSLKLEGVVKAYGLEKYQRTLVITLEDFGGESLKTLIENHSFTLAEFLQVAIKITQTLGLIHQEHIIHKDINSANIVVNPKTGHLKIIDFGIATKLSRENPIIKNPNVLEGTLAYMSPEQTGRMNRSLDYRTDFYSLGVTFYELLTQQLPFDTSDALELVHAHIAKQPLPPHRVKPEIPKAVSDIVMKLLAKTAEERYQSAWGLKVDLETCLAQLEAKGRLKSFPLGRQDISGKFQIPQKLYGREQEIETLIAAFERVSAPPVVADRVSGGAEMMLVAGYSGIGKSALVQEIYRPITHRRGYFVTGKFDQFQRNVPYSAVVRAFTDLVRQLLTEDEMQLNQWRQKLLAAFGPNGQVIIDVIPEVELIVGPQPAVQALGPTEAQNRFNLLFQNFIHVLCQPDHPLVIFLDDLQWADSATLKLLELILTDEDTGYLFLIGAYRDNEVSPTHPLMLTLDKLRKEGAVINQIDLTPLSLDHINHLVADTLQADPQTVRPLARLLMRKTNGNPFFANQFLNTLYQENLLTFDPERLCWQWNLAHIEAMGITDNVVDLMVDKLRKLPVNTLQVVRLAACVGNHFDLNTLAIINEMEVADTFQHLLPAVQEGLILPMSELEPLNEDIDAQLFILNYKFLHDRVQQPAYALIDDDQKKAIHLKIGRLLLANTPVQARSEYLFTLVDHLNIGRDLITDWQEQVELARLNLEASQKAKEATAYVAARQYLIAGMAGLSEESWRNQYGLTLAMVQTRAQVEYLNGNFDQSEEFINLMLDKVQSDLEKAEIYNLLIVQYTLVGKLVEAIQAGRQALALLDVELPKSDLPASFDAELVLERKNRGHREIGALIDEPEMSILEKKVATRLLKNTAPPSYMTDLDLFSVVNLKIVNLSLQYGNVPESSLGYSNYGLLLGSALGDYKSGYEFGLLAVKLSEKFNNLAQKCTACFLLGSTMNNWVKHIKHSHVLNDEAYQAGLEAGELQFAGYSLMCKAVNLFYQGELLSDTLAEINKFLPFVRKTKNQFATDPLLACDIIIRNLSGLNEGPFSFDTDELNEAAYLERCQHNYYALCTYYTLKSQVLYLYDQPAQALDCASEAKKHLAAITGHIQMAAHNFYYSLALAALYPAASQEDKLEYWEQLEANQKQMKIWADSCPENFLHKHLLVAAEMSRISGNSWEALELYDAAIEAAHKNGFTQDEALTHEQTAKFWLNRDNERYAETHLSEAYYSYQLWGAKRKTDQLEAQYAQLLGGSLRAAPFSLRGSDLTVTASATSSKSRSGEVLDLAAVLKASQTISGEIVLEALLKKLMKIVIENAGAERGFLILDKAGQWVIEAEGGGDKEVAVLQSIPVQTPSTVSRLPATIINYVIRVQKPVVLNDAAHEDRFAQDDYIQANQPKSILCFPLIKQAKLTGILYLENNLTTAAFTPDRLEVLNLLSSQAAISTENARLYTDLQASEKKYRTLFEDSKDVIFISTASGQFLDINPACLSVFGYTRAEIMHMKAQELYANPKDRLRFQQEVERHGSVKDLELTYLRKDETRIDCLVTATLRQAEDGTIGGYQGIIRDITERKRAEKERLQLSAIQRELDVAREIQQSLLPPAKPGWSDLEVICYSMPAREVGGDFYSYHAFSGSTGWAGREAKYALAVGDVSGKGVSAALLMATGLSQFDAALSLNLTPTGRVAYLDKAISAYTRSRRQNCALCYVEIVPALKDTKGGELRVVNAGCIPPYIKRRSGEVEELDVGGFALGQGLGAQFGYQEVSLTLAQGDLVIMTSDGVVEANNAAGEMLGFERLEAAVASGPTSSAEAMLDHLKRKVTAFVGEAEPYDDLTMVVVQV